MPLDETPSGLVFTSGRPLLVESFDRGDFSPELAERMRRQNIKSGCGVRLVAHGRKIGVVAVASYRESAFTEDNLELLSQIAG
jgi:GAF domain-containing protein